MARPDTAPLVGRSAELALLSRTIDEAASGTGRSVFIIGEGGIGKTRLAAAVAERASKRGWSVAIGRAYPVETGVPYERNAGKTSFPNPSMIPAGPGSSCIE